MGDGVSEDRVLLLIRDERDTVLEKSRAMMRDELDLRLGFLAGRVDAMPGEVQACVQTEIKQHTDRIYGRITNAIRQHEADRHGAPPPPPEPQESRRIAPDRPRFPYGVLAVGILIGGAGILAMYEPTRVEAAVAVAIGAAGGLVKLAASSMSGGGKA